MTHNPSKRHRWNCGPANRVLPGPVSHYLLPLGFQSHNTHRQSRIYLGSTFPGKTKQLFKSSKIFFYRRQIYVWQFSVGKWILWSRSLRQSYTFPERWLHWNGRRTHCSAGSLEGRRRLVVIWIAWARRGAEQERSCFFKDLSDVWNKYNQYNQQPDTFSALALDAVFSAKARSFWKAQIGTKPGKVEVGEWLMTRCDMIRCDVKIISYVLIELTWIDCMPVVFSILFSSSRSWYPRHVDVGTRVIRCGREFRSSAQYEHWELSTPLKLTLKLATVKWVKCQTPKPPESCRLCHKELFVTLSESPNLLSSSGALASSSLPNHHRHLKWIQVRAVAG